MIWSIEFWKAVAERAITTFCWTMISVIGVGATDLGSVRWQFTLSAAALATLLSVFKSVGVNWATKTGPSLTSAEQIAPVGTQGRHERPDA
jgi:hypothetical protein